MQLAFSTISCPDYDLDQIVRAREEYGYDAVELYALGGHQLDGASLFERRAEIQRGLRGTPVVCVNSSATLASSDAEQQAHAEQLVVAAMRAASTLESPFAKVFGGELPSGAAESSYDAIAGSVERILDATSHLGVTLIMETHDGFCLGSRLAKVLQRIDSPSFAALWDVHHPYRMGESPNDTDHAIGARVRHVHIKDARRRTDGWDYTLLGEGEIPVGEILSLLDARGFTGRLSLDWEKMWHPEIADPEIALPRYRTALAQLVAEISRERVTTHPAARPAEEA